LTKIVKERPGKRRLGEKRNTPILEIPSGKEKPWKGRGESEATGCSEGARGDPLL